MLLADRNTVFDEKKVREVAKKVSAEKITEADFTEVFETFGMLCNHSVQMRFELRGYTKSFQIEIDAAVFTIEIDNGACSCYEGKSEIPNVTLGIATGCVLELLNKQVYGAVAHMNGDIKVRGLKPDALRFLEIFELFLDELRDYE